MKKLLLLSLVFPAYLCCMKEPQEKRIVFQKPLFSYLKDVTEEDKKFIEWFKELLLLAKPSFAAFISSYSEDEKKEKYMKEDVETLDRAQELLDRISIFNLALTEPNPLPNLCPKGLISIPINRLYRLLEEKTVIKWADFDETPNYAEFSQIFSTNQITNNSRVIRAWNDEKGEIAQELRPILDNCNNNLAVLALHNNSCTIQ